MVKFFTRERPAIDILHELLHAILGDEMDNGAAGGNCSALHNR
jgi:hypothetical protein